MSKTEKKTAAPITNFLDEAKRLAHDLQAPLMVLRGTFARDASQVPSADLIRRSVESLYEMSRSYLEGATSSNTQTISTLSVKKILRETLANVPTLAQAHGLHCQAKLYDYLGLQQLIATNKDTSFIQVDKEQLRRIFSNIINNAIEALSAQNSLNTLLCTLHLEDTSLIIQIQDNGRGLQPSLQAQVFKEGFTYGKPKGQGIGLSSARKILRSWNADVEFESSPGKGSIVTIRLPLQQTAMPHELN